MTDKELKAKILAEIERLKNQEIEFMEHQGYTDYHTGLRDAYSTALDFINSLHKEPVRSIWHDASEEPKEGYTIVVYMNDDSLKVLTSWDENGDFCIGDGFWYNIHQQKSWAYKDNLLDKKEEPINSNEHELSLIAIEALDKKRLCPDLKGLALHKFNNEWNTIKQVICLRSIGEIKLNYRLALHWASWGAQNLKNYFGMSDEEKAEMDIPIKPVNEDLI